MDRFLVFISLFAIGIAADLPSGFPTCKRSDSDLNGCLKKAIEIALPIVEKGIPEFNVASGQPLFVPSIIVEEGTSTVHVVQKFKDVNLFNLFRPKIDKVEANITDSGFDLDMDALFEELSLDGVYDFNGRILVLPIVGNGACNIVSKNVKSHIAIHGEEIKKKGQAYYEIKNFTISLNPEKTTFNFMNLFNGDKILGDEMNMVLNENWKNIWDDVGFAYEEIMGLIFKNTANLIFKRIPHIQIYPQ